MSELLPSTRELSREPDPTPRVIGLDSNDADELMAALSSDTARDVLAALHRDPSTPSEIADTVDTSIQNAQYHLEKLENAELIEEVDTWYSEKGREMTVYAPASGPLVVFPGDTDDGIDLEDALRGAIGGIGVLGIIAVAIEAITRGMVPGLSQPGTDGPSIMEETPPASDGHWLVEGLTGLSPGVLFFLGGLTVIAVLGAATLALRRR